MTVEERRQCLYASLLRFTPEATSLRERALDRLILGSLVGSSEQEPFRVGRIRDNIRSSSGSVSIRTETVQSALARLVSEGKVSETEYRRRHAYCLTESGNQNIATSEATSAKLFEPVLAELIKDLDSSIDVSDATDIFISFISLTFSAFGHKIAKVVTGGISSDDFVESINVNQLIGQAIGTRTLQPHVIDSIRARCKKFIKSEDPESDRLKFRLTQGFYVAQLIGIDSAPFNPLARESFEGSIMFLDTNAVMSRIMDLDEASMFDEIVAISSDLGIEVRISRATIDELEDVLPERLDDLRRVVETVPHELIEHAEGDFIDSYNKWLISNPGGMFEDFVSQLETVDSIIGRLEIALDNRSSDEMIGGRNVEKMCSIISSAAEESRGWGKSDLVSKHDAAHFLAVTDLRSGGGKSWFLTRDRTLTLASSRLSEGGIPFSMPLLGFLQAISPFVDANGGSDALADFFSHGLSKDISGLGNGSLFDLQELRLIGEYHEDVMATPPEELVLALDYVKSSVLNGKRYRPEDNPKFSLGLKKFLSSSSDDKKAALSAEVERKDRLLDEERANRAAVQKQLADERAEIERLTANASGNTGAISDAQKETRKAQREARGLRGALFVLGGLIAVAIWNLDDAITALLIDRAAGSSFALGQAQAGVRLIGSLIFAISSLPVILKFKGGARVGLLTVSLAVAVMGADLIASATLSAWSDVLGVCAPIALLIYLVVSTDRGESI